VSLLLIVLNDFPKFVNFCQKIRGFLKKNSGIVENYFLKKLLTRQKNRSYVTLGKMLLGKMLPRQTVT